MPSEVLEGEDEAFLIDIGDRQMMMMVLVEEKKEEEGDLVEVELDLLIVL